MNALRMLPAMHRITQCAFLLCALLVGTWTSASCSAISESSQTIPLTNRSVLGQPNAKVALVIFSDFQCPYCGQLARDVLPEFQRDEVQKGLVSITFRNLPLRRIHRQAESAAKLALCAESLGHFWPVHDQLFARPQNVVSGDWNAIAMSVPGMPRFETLGECIGASAPALDEDEKLASRLRITSTPTLVVARRNSADGGVVTAFLRGLVDISTIRRAVDEATRK